MFSKKRKQKKEQQAREASENRVKTEQVFDVLIQNASAIKDPSQKVIELHKIENDIADRLNQTRRAINKEALKRGEKAQDAAAAVSGLGMTGAFAYFLAAGAVAAGPVTMIAGSVALTAMISGKIISAKRYRSTKKNLQLAAADHIKNLEGQADLVRTIMDVTVESNVATICKSPLHAKILEIPELSNKFAAAAVNHIATTKEPAEAAPPAEEKKPAAARKKQPPKYDELNGL